MLLYRYVDEAEPLEQRTRNLDLHAGSSVQGSIKRWHWTLTGNYDRSRASAAVDQGIALETRQAAIDAGGDPLTPFTPAEVANRIVTRSRTVTGTIVGKATANGPVLKLPAGDAQMTLTGDYARSTSSGGLFGAADPALDLRRVSRGASVNIDVPIASASRGVLDAIGSLTANGTIGVSSVSNYGSLVSSYAGLTWTPVAPVQVTASINTTQTPPAIGLLTAPVVSVPNVPYFDFVTGNSALVTVVAGGNADLAPERRRISTIGASWKPINAKELRLNLDYIETRIDGQTSYLSSVTPALQAAFPDRFTRDAAGQLLTVDLRPVNLTREVERKVQAKVSLFAQVGAEPQPPTAPPAKDAPPPPKPRPMIYAFATAAARLDDTLVLQRGQATLDLLAGDTLDGTGGRPRYELVGGLGGSYGPIRTGFYVQSQASTRIRSAIASSDLSFSSRNNVYLYATIEAEMLVSRTSWNKKMTFQFENRTCSMIASPYATQPVRRRIGSSRLSLTPMDGPCG